MIDVPDRPDQPPASDWTEDTRDPGAVQRAVDELDAAMAEREGEG